MKINKYISLAALAVAFTACQDDTLGESNQQGTIYTLSGEVSEGKAMSRAQIVLGNTDGNKESFMWNEGDAFTLYQGSETQWAQRVYTISNDYKESGSGDKKNAEFTTTNPALADDYVAFYPANLPMEGNWLVKFNLQRTLDFSEGINPNEVWSNYLQDNMFMIAEGTLSGTGVNTVIFRHMMSLARITYTNETGSDQQITSIGLGGNIAYVPEPYIELNDKEHRLGSSWSTSLYDLATNGLTVEAGKTFEFYILFTPVSFEEGGNFDIILNHGNGFKTASLATSTIATANNGYCGFEAGKRYWFKVTESKDELVFSKDYVETVTIENVELSAALYDVLGADNVKLDSDSYAVMTKEYAESVKELYLGWKDLTITSMTGIENFTNLETLDAPAANIESCDLSQNTKLYYVNLSFNKIKSLDFSKNSVLSNLNCSFNENLEEVILSGCTALTSINVENTSLSSLVVPNPENVHTLYYGNTQIPVFDLAKFVVLETLDVDNMSLTNLDFIPNTIKAQLTTFFCDDNSLATLDLTLFPKLEDLHCNRNNITVLNLKATSNLTSLACTENQISSLDISHLNIGTLACGNQKNNISLTLTMDSTQESEWNSNWSNSSENKNVVPDFSSEEPTVETITIENAEFSNALQSVESLNGKITFDSNGYAIIAKADADAITEIKIASGYTIQKIDQLEKFPNLTHFSLRYCKVKEADLSHPTLKTLNLANNNLQILDLTDMPNLKSVDVSTNNLTDIIFAEENKITTLLIYSNYNLSNLDLSNCNLVSLQCYQCALETLDLSSCTNLNILICYYNKLSMLDLTSNVNVYDLYCGGQQDGQKLKLKLPESLMNVWNTKWNTEEYASNFENVVLDAPNSGNTGGSDFTIEGIY